MKQLGAAVAALGLALLPAQEAGAATSIAISNFSFQPASTTVPVGATVTWSNRDSTMHSVTSDTGAFDSGGGLCPPANCLSPGASFSHQFNAPGTYRYHCNIHSFMQGTIVVSGPTTTTTAATSPPRTTPTTVSVPSAPTSAPRTTPPTTAVPAPSTLPTTAVPARAASPPTTSGATGGSSSGALPAATHRGTSVGGVIVALVALVAVLVAGLLVYRRWRSASAAEPPA